MKPANVIYTFFWGEFCDWYIELVKPRLAGGRHRQPQSGSSTGGVASAAVLFETALRLLSPIMPFITEEFWHAHLRGRHSAEVHCAGRISPGRRRLIDDEVETQMAILQDLIVSVRNVRAELKIEPSCKRAHPGVRRRRNPRSCSERNLERRAAAGRRRADRVSSRSRWPSRPERAAPPASTCA